MSLLDKIPHWAVKVIGTLILFLLSMIFGALPLKLQRDATTDRELGGSTRKLLISLSNCFAGGVFFSTVILDLFPNVKETINEALNAVDIDNGFPLANFIIGFGFIFMLILEQVVGSCCQDSFINHGHSHGNHGGKDDVFANDPDETRHLLHGDDDDEEDFPDDIVPRVIASGQVEIKKSVTMGPSTILSGNSISYTDSEDELQKSFRSQSSSGSYNTYYSENGTHHRVRKLQRTKSLASMQSIRTSNFRLYMMVFAISLHSMFEGLSVGLLVDTQVLLQILMALLIHKSIIAFSIGVQLVEADLSTKVVLICLAIFASMAPLGVALGLLLLKSLAGSVVKVFLSGILQGIATGTFLYVTFFEVLPHELNIVDRKLLKIMFVLLGYLVITGVCYFEKGFHRIHHLHPSQNSTIVDEIVSSIL